MPRAKTETVMADETSKFDIPALGNSAFGIPNRRQFIRQAACAALGEVTRKYPRASPGVRQEVDREQKRVKC